MAISRSDARQLAKHSAEMGARVLRGTLTIEPDGLTIDGTRLAEFLAEYNGSEFILIAAPIGRSYIESEIKTCFTCGRDYRGDQCPHCAEARARLRG
ncbi:MAG: hypothetical protein FOGNACKC_01847 [Anaerolineae bacterium]|nr:hypothetical protein [Anaerolineae bacterium]